MCFSLHLSTWAEMQDRHQREVRSLIEAGGEVRHETLPRLLRRARQLAFAVDGSGRVLAVAALKTPNASYRDKVFSKAGAEADGTRCDLELGWIFAAPLARGHRLGERLSDALLRSVLKPVYATSAEDNDHRHVHAMLARLGFTREGRPYLGASGRMMRLFVRREATA